MLSRLGISRCCCGAESQCGSCTCEGLRGILAPKSGAVPCCIIATVSGATAISSTAPCNIECDNINGTHLFAWDEENLHFKEDECGWYKYICCAKQEPFGPFTPRAQCDCLPAVAVIRLSCSGSECTIALSIGASFTSDPIPVKDCTDLAGRSFSLTYSSAAEECNFAQATVTVSFESPVAACEPVPCTDITPCLPCGDGSDCTKQVQSIIVEIPDTLFKAAKPGGDEELGLRLAPGPPHSETCEEAGLFTPCRCEDGQCLQGAVVVLDLDGSVAGTDCSSVESFKAISLCPHSSDGLISPLLKELNFETGQLEPVDLTGRYINCCGVVRASILRTFTDTLPRAVEECRVNVEIEFKTFPLVGLSVFFSGQIPVLANGDCDCDAGTIELAQILYPVSDGKISSHDGCCACINETNYNDPPWNLRERIGDSAITDHYNRKQNCISSNEDCIGYNCSGDEGTLFTRGALGLEPLGHRGGCNVHNGLGIPITATLIAGC